MFEVGFTELLLIFVLGLIVLGPQKLPQVAAQLGRWVGRARALAREFREQLEAEAMIEPAAPRKAATPEPAPASPPPAPAPAPADPDVQQGGTPDDRSHERGT